MDSVKKSTIISHYHSHPRRTYPTHPFVIFLYSFVSHTLASIAIDGIKSDKNIAGFLIVKVECRNALLFCILHTVKRHVPEGHFQASSGPKDILHLLQAVLRGLLDVALALQVGYNKQM